LDEDKEVFDIFKEFAMKNMKGNLSEAEVERQL